MRHGRALLFALTLTPACLAAQRPLTPDARLEAAQHQELVTGDLDRAIALYRELLAVRDLDRGLAARALASLGRAYEKLGSKEARAAYERLVREYADQAEPVRYARGRLAALSNGVRTGASRLVFSELPALRPREDPHYDFSPAGDRIVYRVDVQSDSLNGVALLVAASGGAVIHTLVPARNRIGITSPRWSPDGRYIAFVSRTFVEVDSQWQGLMLVPVEGGPARVLNDSLQFLTQGWGGVFWLPDSRGVTVVTDRGLVTFGLTGNRLHEVPLRTQWLSHVTGYSPDGRWLTMHRRPDGSQQNHEMDVWLMPAAGGNPVPVTDAPGFDGWPRWAEDGRGLYFVSDRSGSHNIWRMEIDPSSGLARGDPVQITNYRDALILHPRTVDRGRKLAFTLVRQTGSVHVGPVTAPEKGRMVARGTKPQLTPDGRTVVYAGQGDEGTGLFTVPAEGGPVRALAVASLGGDEAVNSFRLSPDGSAVAWFGRTGNQNVLSIIPTAGGTLRELIRLESREGVVPSWSPDGRQLAYSHNGGLYSIAAAGGPPARLAELGAWEGWTVRWSPDGRHIAALGYESSATPIAGYAVPADGGAPRRLTPASERGYKEGLEWHPDSERLSYMYYGSDGRGDGSRMAYLDGRATTLLVDQPNPQWDYVGLWHPAGTYYFVSSRERAWDLYAHSERTGTSRLVLGRAGTDPGVSLPSFSRDGELMTWTVMRTTRQLWTIDIR